MSDFIHVETRPLEKSAKLNFVLGISSVAIAADMARGEDSLVRKHFGDMPEMIDYVKNNLSTIQRVVASEIAFFLSNGLQPLRPQPLPTELHFSFLPWAPRLTQPDGYVGDFALWYVSDLRACRRESAKCESLPS
jgi:hypothetical protein